MNPQKISGLAGTTHLMTGIFEVYSFWWPWLGCCCGFIYLIRGSKCPFGMYLVSILVSAVSVSSEYTVQCVSYLFCNDIPGIYILSGNRRKDGQMSPRLTTCHYFSTNLCEIDQTRVIRTNICNVHYTISQHDAYMSTTLSGHSS